MRLSQEFLRLFGVLPHDRLRVFSSTSREGLGEQLEQENKGLLSTSVTAAQFLRERMICLPAVVRQTSAGEERTSEERVSIAVTTLPPVSERGKGGSVLGSKGVSAIERRREELESGHGGDHDLPYCFSLPLSLPQVRAWMTLLVRVQRGELHPEGTWDEQQLAGNEGLPVCHVVGS